MPLQLSRADVRRYVLGRQGLWPGKRWSADMGLHDAFRNIRTVQIDPLNVLARSHDLALHARVAGYRPEQLLEALYTSRDFFDYGGVLFIRPMSDLPHWRLHMRRRRDDPKWAPFAAENGPLLDAVRRRLRDSGPLGNRDFGGKSQASTFRSGKDTARALYYLWLTGELMTHGRRDFERLYFFTEDIAPAELQYESPIADAEDYMARAALDFAGLAPERMWRSWYAHMIGRKVDKAEGARCMAELVEAGAAVPVTSSAGGSTVLYAAGDCLPQLEAVAAGEVPQAWRPIGPDTRAEATLLAPLDIVSARGRALTLFDFEYVWEVYKPAAARRWGYYTMPVLYGDRLVARIDPAFDRKTSTLVVKGFWFEDGTLTGDPDFAAALAAAVLRLGRMLGALALDVEAVASAPLRQVLAARFASAEPAAPVEPTAGRPRP